MPYALDDLQCQWLGFLQENHCKFERSVWGGGALCLALFGVYGKAAYLGRYLIAFVLLCCRLDQKSKFFILVYSCRSIGVTNVFWLGPLKF